MIKKTQNDNALKHKNSCKDLSMKVIIYQGHGIITSS